AADVLPPEMPDRASDFSIGPTLQVDQRAAVWRELRQDDAWKLGDVEKRHRPFRLSAWQGAYDGGDGDRRDEANQATPHVPPTAHATGSCHSRRGTGIRLARSKERRCL